MSGDLGFLAGGGEAARMIRERDWTDHPLGPPEAWRPEFRSALSLVLNSPESMILAWGPELSFFFNDTYFPLLGPRLSWAMGERFDKVWADAWDQAKPIIDAAFAGRSERFEDLPWRLDTDRGAADTWWSFSYSRVLDGAGQVAGLFIFTNETTARVLGEAALRDSEEQLRLVVEGAKDHAILTTDPAGLITSWSAGAQATFGWSREEIVGRSASVLFTPEDRAANVPPGELMTAAREGYASDERWHLTKSGHRVFMNGSVHPLPHDAQDRERGFIKIARDETERRQADEALRRSEASARENIQRVQLALAAGAIIGTWFWDLPSDRFTVDEAFARSFGLDPALGREGIPLARIVATVHPDDQAGLAEAIDEAITRGGTYAHQYRVRRADGRYYWIEANGRVEKGADGTPQSFPGVLLDIEERRAAQEALRASEAHWRGLFARLTEGFVIGEVIRDTDGRITDWRYVDVNAAWGRLVGIDTANVIGRTVREVLPGIEDAWVHEFAGVVETGQPVTFTRQVGTLRRWYEGRAFALGAERFGVLFLETTDRIEADTRRDALLVLGDRLRETAGAEAITMAACETLGSTLAVELVGYGDVDPRAETITVERDWTTGEAESLSGTLRFRDFGSYIEDLKRGDTVVVTDCRTDARTRAHASALEARSARAFVNMPVFERGLFVALLYVSTAQAREWADAELSFIRDVASRLRQAITRVRAEEERDLINQEISHRLKNTLAMVLSIASQTLRAVPERAPVEAFEQRIHALSHAHDVLLRKSWAAAPATDVVKAVLAGAGHGDRIDVSGPELDLGPRATLSLALLLHELATNAAKYGALSVAEGRVAVDWQIIGDDDNREVTFAWTERGGPPVTPPATGGRKGFGSRLISVGLAGTGGVDLRFPPSGFQATMRAPLVTLQSS